MAALGYFNELKEKYNKILVVTESDAFARVLVDTLAGRNVGLKQRIGVLAAEGLGYCRWKEPFITSFLVFQADRDGAAGDGSVIQLHGRQLQGAGQSYAIGRIFPGKYVITLLNDKKQERKAGEK